MSSSSDDKKRRDRIPGFPSLAFDSSIQKAIERSKIHIFPESISSQIASSNKAVEALNSQQIANASLASQLIEQQRSLASEILGRHGERFAAVEAATRNQQEIGHVARAAIESMKIPGVGAVAQAMRMISPLMDSNQLIPPAYTAAYASMHLCLNVVWLKKPELHLRSKRCSIYIKGAISHHWRTACAFLT